MAVKIYADAGSNLFPEFLKEKNLDITIVKMKLFIAGKEYNCYDENLDTKQLSKTFYEELSGNDDIHTSLINPNDYMEAFKTDIEKGNKIICFTMAKGISGTYQSACLARDMINEEKGEEMVYIVDSATAGFGEGLQAIEALKNVQKGDKFEEIYQKAEEFKWKVRSEFTVDDIMYLAKTGRVSKVVAKIANVLKIKVLLKGSNESNIVQTGKVAGRKLSIKKLVNQCAEYIRNPDNQTVYLTHSNCYDDAMKMKLMLIDEGIKNVEVYNYDLVTGSHLGPNALAIFYVGEDREFKPILPFLKKDDKEEVEQTIKEKKVKKAKEPKEKKERPRLLGKKKRN